MYRDVAVPGEEMATLGGTGTPDHDVTRLGRHGSRGAFQTGSNNKKDLLTLSFLIVGELRLCECVSEQFSALHIKLSDGKT